MLVMIACAAPATPAPTAAAPTSQAGATPKAAVQSLQPLATPKPSQDQPKYGGVLTTTISSDPSHFDFHQEPGINVQEPVRPAYSGLVRYDPAGTTKVQGDLAESWEASADGKTYTFHLRKGIQFHDGVPLTSEDVRNSLERQRKPPQGILSVRQSYLDPVSEIRAPDADTVQILLKDIYAPIMPVLAMGYWGVYPKHVLEAKKDMKHDLVGSGPFKFKAFTPGTSLELAKNPTYYFPGKPYLDGLTFYVMKDRATAFAAFRTGQIKVSGRSFAAINGVDADIMKKEKPEVKLYPDPSVLAAILQLNLTKPPFSDLRVRQAVNLTLDRQAAVSSVTQGHGRIIFMFTLWDWGIPYDELLKLPGYRQPKDQDVADAKKLLADAGYANGFKLTIMSRTMPITKSGSEFVTGQLSKIGITATVDIQEDASFFDKGRRADFEAAVPGYTNAIADPVYAGIYLLSSGSMNYMKYDDKKVNDLWEQQLKTLDEAKRKQIFYDMEKRIYDQAPEIPIVGPTDYIAQWPDVRGWTPGMSDYAHFEWENVWLSK